MQTKHFKEEGPTKIRQTVFLLAQYNFDWSIKCSEEVEVHFTKEKLAEKLLQYASSLSLSGSFLEAKEPSALNWTQYVTYGLEFDITTKEIQEFLVDDQGKSVFLVTAPEPVCLKH